MIRFLFRVMASFCFATAIMFTVMDATRSIGASQLVLTPLADSWDLILDGTREQASQWLAAKVHPMASDPVLSTFVSWPTFAVFAGFALLFYLIGRRPDRRISRFTSR